MRQKRSAEARKSGALGRQSEMGFTLVISGRVLGHAGPITGSGTVQKGKQPRHFSGGHFLGFGGTDFLEAGTNGRTGRLVLDAGFFRGFESFFSGLMIGQDTLRILV